MDTLEAIHTRRSIRKFIDKDVSNELIEQILDAAMTAPSAGNQQPWSFVVIKDKLLLEKISQIHTYAQMAKEANLAILVCSNPTICKYNDMWDQDCSAAIQNMLLSAHALGLGAVWCGIYPKEHRAKEFKQLFNLPEEIIPFSLVVIGYTDLKCSKVDRYKKDRIHYNTW